MSEYKFPDEMEDSAPATEVEAELPATDELEVEIVDSTPEKDRGRKPLERDVEDPTEEELQQYSTCLLYTSDAADE